MAYVIGGNPYRAERPPGIGLFVSRYQEDYQSLTRYKMEISHNKIVALLIVVIVILIAGFFVYPEYKEHQRLQALKEFKEDQERARKNQLVFELEVMQYELPETLYGFEVLETKSLLELETIKREIEVAIEYQDYLRRCSSNCMSESTFNLAKAFED